MPLRHSIDELVALHARTLGDEEDEDVIVATDDYSDAFGWIDWRATEREVVEAVAPMLDEGDVLSFREDDDERVTPIRNGVEFPVPLTMTGSDRYVMLLSLAEILKDRYEVLLQSASLGDDTHGFLVVPHAQAAELRQRHRKWFAKHLEALTPGLDGFSGLQVPWLGHEDAAPDFVQKRRKLDAARQRAMEGGRREIDAYVADLRASERGEKSPSENFLYVRVRQERAAWMYFVAALVSAVATVAGVPATTPGTGWISVALLVASGAWHGWLVTRMRAGWRPPVVLRFVPAIVLLGVVFAVPGWVRAG